MNFATRADKPFAYDYHRLTNSIYSVNVFGHHFLSPPRVHKIMSEAKFKIKIGHVQFSGSGSEQWLSAQMEKMLSRAKDLASLAPALPEAAPSSNDNAIEGTHPKIMGKTLPKFLTTSNAKKPLVRKFLATAAWCHVAKDRKFLTVADITAALRDVGEGRLGNASQ